MEMLEDAAGYGNGAYYQASDASQLSAALAAIIEDAKGKASGSAAAASVNSGRLETGSTIYQAHYDSIDWSGDLFAYALDPTDEGAVNATPTWQASNNIPAEAAREIFTYDSTASSGAGASVRFGWDALTATMQTTLSNGVNATYGEELTNWIRGDSGTSGSYNPSFRTRSTLLGDIVNSAPLFVGQNDFNHDLLPSTEGSSYNSFISDSNYTSRTDTIYAGANDGMLHAY